MLTTVHFKVYIYFLVENSIEKGIADAGARLAILSILSLVTPPRLVMQ